MNGRQQRMAVGRNPWKFLFVSQPLVYDHIERLHMYCILVLKLSRLVFFSFAIVAGGIVFNGTSSYIILLNELNAAFK